MKTVTNRDVLAKVSGGEFTLSEVGGVLATATAIGAGYGASSIISATPGGYAALEAGLKMPVGGAYLAGASASFLAGFGIGTFAYHNSTMVQNGSQAVIGAGFSAVRAIANFFSQGSARASASAVSTGSDSGEEFNLACY